MMMISGWWTASASLFMDIFIVSYIVLYVNCKDARQPEKCKDRLSGKVGAVMCLMFLQIAIEFYLALVAHWYYRAYDKDHQN